MDDVVLDASVFVSRLLPSDTHHATSAAWFDRVTGGGGFVIVPALMPAEVAGAIARRLDDPALARRALVHLLRIPSLRVIALDRRLGERAAELAAELGLRGADATYVAVAEQLRLPLVTWDREQRDRTHGTIAAVAPSA